MTKNKLATLYLVRHGEPSVDDARQLEEADPGLSAIWVAEHGPVLAERLAAIGTPSKVFVGTSRRMSETMQAGFPPRTLFSFVQELTTTSVYVGGKMYGRAEPWHVLNSKWCRFRDQRCEPGAVIVAITSGMIMEAALADADNFYPTDDEMMAAWRRHNKEHGRNSACGDIWRFDVEFPDMRVAWLGAVR